MSTTLQFSRKRAIIRRTLPAALIALGFSILGLMGCSQEAHRDPLTGAEIPAEVYKSALGQQVVPVAGQIKVTDSKGTAIANAAVLIGLRENVPFPGNLIKTDSAGVVALPAAWTTAQPVTVEAAGFVRATWMTQSPHAMVLALRKKVPTQSFELKGVATGFPPLVKDDWLDVGVIFPAVRRDQLATLQVSDLISPQIDTLSIMGQTVEIPSNVSIPRQEERYYFNITLDKPIYRTYFHEAGVHKMVTTHVRFPFNAVVDDMRSGKSFYELINYFEFKTASLTDVSITAAATTKDLPIAGITFDGRLDVAAPRFASKYTMLAVSVAENGGMLYPTDVKKLNSGETRRLVAPQRTPGFLLGALRETAAPTIGPEADAMSAVITPNNMTTRFEFLDQPGAPKVRGGSLILDPPRASVASVTPAVTLATLNKVDKITAGARELEMKSPVWDVYSNGWTPTMDLPDFTTRLTGLHRWEVLFGGAPNGTTVQLGPNIVEGLTHLSKSAVDL